MNREAITRRAVARDARRDDAWGRRAVVRAAPIAVTLVTAAATVWLWSTLHDQRDQSIHDTIQRTATETRNEVVARMDARRTALLRMAEQWDIRGVIPRRQWQADAALHLTHYPGYEALAWADTDGVARWSWPAADDGAALHPQVVSAAAAIRGWLKSSDRVGVGVSDPFKLDDGRSGFLVAAPIQADGRSVGYVVGVCRAEAWFDSMIGRRTIAPNYHVAITSGGHHLYHRGGADQSEPTDDQTGLATASIGGAQWRLSVWPNADTLDSMRSPLPRVVLMGGLITAALLGLTCHLLGTARRRAGALGRANRKLRRLNRTLDQRVEQRTGDLAASRTAALNIAQDAELARRAAEGSAAQLRDTTERLAAVVNTAVDGIITINSRGVIESINPAVTRIFGYTADELVGRNVSTLMPDPDRTRHDGYLRHYHASGERRIIGIGRQVVAQRKDGSTFPMYLSIGEFVLNGDRYFTGIVRDVTDQMRAESDLRTANNALTERAAELERFVYTVSHDLKSPIVTCLGFIGVMREDLAAGRLDDLPDSLDRIGRAADRMHRSIDDLLELNRIGRLPNEPEPVNLGRLVRQIVDDLATRIDEADAEVRIADDLPIVRADRRRITEVFENLITNALKYGCSGEDHTIEIAAEHDADEVRVCVRDHGQGIDPRYHQRVFGLFERLSRERDGSGVGLAIVARIMEVHGGRAWVESEPGRGAAFYIALPRTTLAAAA